MLIQYSTCSFSFTCIHCTVHVYAYLATYKLVYTLFTYALLMESVEVLGTAFPGAMYTIPTRTKHTTNITGMDNVRALDGYLIQCAYEDPENLIKSNVVTFSFIPPGPSQNTFSVECALTRFSPLCK